MPHTKADNTIAIYNRLREQPLWRLLASATGPAVIGLLQTHLFEGERKLPRQSFTSGCKSATEVK